MKPTKSRGGGYEIANFPVWANITTGGISRLSKSEVVKARRQFRYVAKLPLNHPCRGSTFDIQSVSLARCFKWSDSPQGYQYWNNVYRKGRGYDDRRLGVRDRRGT